MVRVMTAQPSSSVDGSTSPAPVTPTPPRVAPRPPQRAGRGPLMGGAPRGPLLLGLAAAVMMVVGAFGAGGVLVRDPLLTNSPLGFWRYGHGRELATALVYLGVGLMAGAWVRLGREVLARRVGGRAVLATAVVWIAPMLVSPPLFTRDVFSYLAQGALPLAGLDPYAVGPEAMPGIFTENVHYFWQDTPAPYGPLFILIAKSVVAIVGDNVILGVVLMRLALLPGLVLLIWALPELTRRLGGRVAVALWIAVANPMMVIHMVGGGHNDLLVVGLLAAGSLLALRGHHVGGIALVTAAMAVKASAGIALPFLVLVWAAHMSGSRPVRLAKATAAGVAVFAVVFAAITVAAGVGLGWLPALSAPSMIVNWMSIPTGVGEFVHSALGLVFDLPKQPFVNVARVIGATALLYIACRQWWAARDGGPDAVRRAGIVLIAVAVLSPATLPWYVELGHGAAGHGGLAPDRDGLDRLRVAVAADRLLPPRRGRALQLALPRGCALLCALAAVSLLRPDPLRWRARAAPAVAADPATNGAEQRAG